MIGAGLVSEGSDGYYVIDDDHPRNQKAIELMREVDNAIESYFEKYDQPSDHLFKWSLSDPDFWEHFSSLYVTNYYEKTAQSCTLGGQVLNIE